MKHEGKQHFSHDHMLIPIEPDIGDAIKCDACEVVIMEPFYGCPLCQFFLHQHCFEAPPSMDHAFHPSHPLALNTNPANPDQRFTCKACGSQGQGFNFSCADQCEFHLHFLCANMPETYLLEQEHSHVLRLVLHEPPPHCKDETTDDDDDDDRLVMACYLCSDDDQSHHQGWLYCCEPCKYVAHLKCLYSKYERKRSEESTDEMILRAYAEALALEDSSNDDDDDDD